MRYTITIEFVHGFAFESAQLENVTMWELKEGFLIIRTMDEDEALPTVRAYHTRTVDFFQAELAYTKGE